jgi:hypothetical protein
VEAAIAELTEPSARYENAQGKVCETRNPGDRSESLDSRDVRAAWFREWREERKRIKASERGREWERRALEELSAGRTTPNS